MGREGIIPAHAGFTTAGRLGFLSTRDHPRTRGVYTRTTRTMNHHRGSSPHTRGLQHSVTIDGSFRGIIPAHAGFTWTLAFGIVIAMDHPRTRGVYPTTRRSSGMMPGSSPHTRGLLPQLPATRELGRIIPAHAGFTPGALPEGLPHGDHPRTRGVYRHRLGQRFPADGSSPHTRGLRQGLLQGDPQVRIIPAHAGFTPARPYRSRRSSDHPRTRGVYSTP